MEPQAKRTILATVLCLIIMIGWFRVQSILFPPPPDAPQSTTAPVEAADAPGGGAAEPAEEQSIAAAPSQPAKGSDADAAPPSKLTVAGASTARAVTLGDDRQDNKRQGFTNPYEFAVTLTPRGAGVESIRLSQLRDHVAKNKKDPDHAPYVLLEPLEDPNSEQAFASFVTQRIRIDDLLVPLAEADWSLVEEDREADVQSATYETVVKEGDADILRIRKTFQVSKASRHLVIILRLENLSDQPRQVIVTEGGPAGIGKEDARTDYRRIATAVVDADGQVIGGDRPNRADVFKNEDHVLELNPGDTPTLWTAYGNKYFACIVCPQPLRAGEAHPSYLRKVLGKTLIEDRTGQGDVLLEYTYRPEGALAPGRTLAMTTEVYCGPKSEAVFESLPERFWARDYSIVRDADRRWCTFQMLTETMLWLLTHIYAVVHNYGIAIIILVIIVRTLLHPVTKYGQINMMKMQKGMAKLKPKIQAIQEQCKNDKQKLNEATMKLYREEGINPAGQVLGCLPMALQMPVWVALWTMLNTNVDMRHEPFFLWINDLSAPDSLIALPEAWHFNIPLLGIMMGGPVVAFNLLPIIMTISMYLQQKLTQKLTQPTTPVEPAVDKDGKPVPDQMAQQQKIMGFMMFFFGFLFYNFPSGLNLYILSSNLLGMLEQFRIKKHIREKDERGEFEAKKKPAPSRGPGFFERLQQKAEAARQVQSSRPQQTRKKGRKARS